MNMYLIKAGKDKSSDALINLDKVLTIRCAHFSESDTYHMAVDYTHQDTVSAYFETKEECLKELTNLLAAMGSQHVNVADFQFREMISSNTDKLKALSGFLQGVVN